MPLCKDKRGVAQSMHEADDECMMSERARAADARRHDARCARAARRHANSAPQRSDMRKSAREIGAREKERKRRRA